MAGYLDQYGAGEERREKIVKIIAVSLVAVIVVGGLLYWFLKNWQEERQAKRFFENLASQDYKSAYARWGCTDAKPCRDYPFAEFMRDWGPAAGKSGGKVVKSRSCGSGVILTVEYGATPPDKLWVQRQDLTIGFSPWPGCPVAP
jgi:hypothetical protein